MANQIFDQETDYVERFVKSHSKQIKMPNFTYLDAKLHPLFKDHIVVLSKNEFPQNVKMTYSWEPPIYSIDQLDSDENFKEHFKVALAKGEKMIKNKKSNKVKTNLSTPANDNKGASPPSADILKVNELLEETKGLGLDSESSLSYEGGEGDSEASQTSEQIRKKKKADKKAKKKAKKEAEKADSPVKDNLDIEQEMDSILKEEEEKNGDKDKNQSELDIGDAIKLVDEDTNNDQHPAAQVNNEIDSEKNGATEDLNSQSSKAKLVDKKDTKDEEEKEVVRKDEKIHKSETISSNEEHKDENITSVPKEESTKTHEEHKDEESKAEEDEVKPEETLGDKFDAIDDDEIKQFIVDYA